MEKNEERESQKTDGSTHRNKVKKEQEVAEVKYDNGYVTRKNVNTVLAWRSNIYIIP